MIRVKKGNSSRVSVCFIKICAIPVFYTFYFICVIKILICPVVYVQVIDMYFSLE